MNKVKKKSGVKGYLWDERDLANIFEQIVVDTFSEWQRNYVEPITRYEAPIYQGPDPREQWHPKGLLKQFIGLVSERTQSGKRYVTTGIPKATGAGTESDPDRAYIITQVLHRGWAAPKARTKPMRFAVWRSELRNPEVETAPPEGIPENPEVAWIFITFARPQERIKLNQFHKRAFDMSTDEFIRMLNVNLEKKFPGRFKKKRISMLW